MRDRKVDWTKVAWIVGLIATNVIQGLAQDQRFDRAVGDRDDTLERAWE